MITHCLKSLRAAGCGALALLALSAVPSAAQSLSLTVHRVSGATQLVNSSDQPVTFDGYTVSSPAGHLNGPWQSLQDVNLEGWDEADNSDNSRLTEFNPVSDTVVEAGGSLSLGSPYAPASPPAALGEILEDLSFQYTLTSGTTAGPPVTYIGPRNSVVLTINLDSGAASMQNESVYFDAPIDGYTIASTTGALLTGDANWNSLQDQGIAGWDEADNSDAFRITEFNPTAMTDLNGGGLTLNLGAPFDVSKGVSAGDTTFEILLAGGGSLPGIIAFQSGSLPGDFDGNGVLDADDIDALTGVVNAGTNLPAYDLNADSLVNPDDRLVWINDLKKTYLGDSNLDGEFSSTDFVLVFTAGEYEDGVPSNSTWGTGDWNGDTEFDTSDFVVAFTAGGYELGPKAAAAVPEPIGTLLLLSGGMIAILPRHRRRL